MTSPDPKSNQGQASEGGGMLPALLAGAGILLVLGLFFFGGDDEAEDAKQADAQAQRSANAQTANANGKGGIAARNVDDAKPRTDKPKPKLNPRIANSIVDNGMAPNGGPKADPSSFESKQDEITYWEDQLTEANRMLEIRERAVESIPGIEEKIRNGNDPENGLAEFEKRKEVVNDNLEKAQKRVKEVEEKLAALRGE